MWDRIRVGRPRANTMMIKGAHLRSKRRSHSQPMLEVLEDRRLMASIQPISNFTVPAQQGYTLPLVSGSTATTPDDQTYTITSSNPDIVASIAQGPFWSLGVNWPGSTSPESSPFTGTLTFQLFQNLTPNTVSEITNLTNQYPTSFQYFSRVVGGFPNATDYVVQGGSPTLNGLEPTPPVSFANENLQQLAFSGTEQLAMANTGAADSNTTQFFITTGSPNSELGYNYTIFGQMVSGTTLLGEMTQVPVMTNTAPGATEVSQPVEPLTITSSTLSSTNPNGVAIIDTTQATAGETATITVTATDSVDHSTTSESFMVSVVQYAGPTTSNLLGLPGTTVNFRPFATVVSTDVPGNTPTTVQLAGTSSYPDPTATSTLTYTLLSQPTHGTISNFNSSTGTLTYTPNADYSGPDTFQFQVNSTGPGEVPAVASSNPQIVNLTVGPGNTGAVRVVGTSPDEVLIVTPLPRRDRGTNKIDVVQVADPSADGGSVIQVVVNGEIDQVQPGIGDLAGIIVYGGNKAKNIIIIDPSVTIPARIDGGHGFKNRLTGGGGLTGEHGWFGHSVLIGGPGPNELVGLAGHVKFKPSKATVLAFTGVPKRRTSDLHPTPPGGTFYRFQNGHVVRVVQV
jgi:cyclophilin family peptidyl-prolyl cis-trans isomerase